MPTSPTETKNNLAEIESELSTLQERNAQALAGVEEARARLDELAARRGAIASRAYFGDAQAVKEIEGLDAETSRLVRVVSLARDAAQSLESDIADAKERLLAKERSRASSEQVAQLRAERQAVRERALEAADALLDVLAADKSLHEKMIAAVQNGGSAAGLESLARNHDEAALHRELATRLRGYAPSWT